MPLLETKGAASAQGFGLTLGGAAPVYIEDVFSTWLYTGTQSTQTITNGIDLSTKGGMVWIKDRTTAWTNVLTDTARGAGKSLFSNSGEMQVTNDSNGYLSAFNSNGFTLAGGVRVNANNDSIASWTFAKQAKFFDVVTYTGNNTNNRQISHNLGSVPGCIIVKCVSSNGAWWVYHRSIGFSDSVFLNSTSGLSGTGIISATSSTTFTIPSATDGINDFGATYVAYLFAHNAGGFGLTGTDNVISCGSYTGNGSTTGPSISLGYEPQWLMIKRAVGGTSAWNMYDTMRGMPVPTAPTFVLQANSSGVEYTGPNNFVAPNATGFNITSTSSDVNTNGDTYIYIAIRRGPMKTPTTGTSVFQADTYSGTGASGRSLTTLSAIYLSIIKWRTGNPFGDGWSWSDRLRGIRQLASNSTASETNHPDHLSAFGPNQNTVTLGDGGTVNGSGMTYVNYAFQRAPGFFDVVCYSGTSDTRTVTHNLGVVPELMIFKARTVSAGWAVYVASLGNNKGITLNNAGASYSTSDWNNTTPTSTVFTLAAGGGSTNDSGVNYVAYLFASCPGVSKVGSYTGDGTVDRVIDCGFTSGARFILLKKTSTTSGWYVYDTARGISSSGEASLLLNSTAAESGVADVIDPASVGFSVGTSGSDFFNESGVSYIFLAIA